MKCSWEHVHRLNVTNLISFFLQDCSITFLCFRIVTPFTSQGTALKKHRRSDSGAVVHAEPLDFGNFNFYIRVHSAQSPYPAILYSM